MTHASIRLRIARERAGYSTAKDAALAMGVAVSTYIQHENGARGIPASRASRYGRFFHVSPSWLLYGKASHDNPRRGVGVVRMVAVVTSKSRLQYKAGLGSVLSPTEVGEAPAAALIEADSLGPIFAGWAVIWDTEEQKAPTEAVHGQLCVVALYTGDVYVRLLKPSPTAGIYHLISNNTDPPIFDVEVMWAARVRAIAPR